jgi:predicted N-acetyltransferase YhbS
MMKIRLEQPKDYREVENLTREAFWNVYRPGCTEHFVLNQYRTNPDFIPELDFVMEEDNRIIGHVMFSKASLTPDPSPMGEGSDDPSQQEMHTTPLPHREGQGGGSFPSWTFGPISIHPDYKRKGYGLKLLQYALEKAREMGVGFICMEGNIDFYKHAGFCLASKFNIHYHDFPKDAEVPFFLAQELIPGWLKENGITEATYCPPKGYFVADENPEAFEAYEATFPKKVELRLPGQLPEQ